MKYLAPFEAGCYYHIFSHAVGFDKLFLEKENYHYFLRQYTKYICPVADVYAYCLMPNHFHFLVRVKPIETLAQLPKFKEDVHKFIAQQWSNLLNSYAKSINKRYNRYGALFVDQIRRAYIDSESYLHATFAYIHQNPVNHGFCKHVDDWQFSSIHQHLHSHPYTLLNADTHSVFQKSQYCDLSAYSFDEMDI